MNRTKRPVVAGLGRIFRFTPDYVFNDLPDLVVRNQRGIIMDAVTAEGPVGSLPAEVRVVARLSMPVDEWDDPDLEVYIAMKGYACIAEEVLALLPAEKVARWNRLREGDDE